MFLKFLLPCLLLKEVVAVNLVEPEDFMKHSQEDTILGCISRVKITS